MKTRLAAEIGKQKALEIYKILLSHTHEISENLIADKNIFYDDFIDENDLWENTKYKKHLQLGSDLGERMKMAFESLFAIGYKKVIIIGSDCYDLTSEILKYSFEILSQYDFVIGPAADGGYYLLGMSHYLPSLFENKNWSSSSVFSDTIHQIKELGFSVHLLKVLNDVDNESDINFF